MLIISLIILQIFIFVGMILILKRIMTQNVTSATQHLEALNKDYLKKEEEVTRALEEARRNSDDITSKAQREAEALKGKILKDTNTESEEIIKNVRAKAEEMIQQADKTRTQLITEINERVAASAIDEAAELIKYTLPEKFRKDIHGQWVEELIEGGFGKLERLNIPKDIKEIKIVSAFALSEEQRKRLAKKIKSILGRDINIKEETDQNVVSGIVINIGSLILDGSLRNKIREQAKNAKYSVGK